MSKPANVVCDPVSGVCRYVPDAEVPAPDLSAPSAVESPLISMLGETLQSKDGPVNVSTIIGPSKVIGLYFSAHWCPPCRGFTPVLSDFYKKFKASHPRKDDLEIVFVSSDRDLASFEEYHAEMPFLALPYVDRDRKAALSKKFKVQGIPTLVFIDADTGKIITTNGRAKIGGDPEAADFPWKPVPFHDLVAGDLVDAAGNIVKGSEALKGKVTLLYFSAHWCPPCKMFTPVLVESYTKLKAAGKNMEAVFVSWDKSGDAFKGYLESMPWLAVPYDQEKVKKALGEMYDVDGIPSLIVIGEDGKVITTRGREAVAEDPDGLQFPWTPQPVEALTDSNISMVNETALLMLVGSGDIKARATELLEPIALQHKSSERADDLVFAYGTPDAEAVGMLLKFAHITPVEGQDTLFVLDVPDQSKFVFDGPALNKEAVKGIVDQYLKQDLPTQPLGR